MPLKNAQLPEMRMITDGGRLAVAVGYGESVGLFAAFVGTWDDTSQAQTDDTPESLPENAAAHLRYAFDTLRKDYGDLFDLESESPCGIFHFYLESVTFHFDCVEVDGFQRFARVTDETCRGVAHRHARYGTHVYGGAV